MKCVLSIQATEQLHGQNTVRYMRTRASGPSLLRQATSCNIHITDAKLTRMRLSNLVQSCSHALDSQYGVVRQKTDHRRL
jgi:hypothetical protein